MNPSIVMKHPEDNLPELIDCCRPQSDDLQLPEMGPLASALRADPQVDQLLKKSHRIDALLRQALRDVPIPIGLEERLLAAVTAVTANPAITADPAVSEGLLGVDQTQGADTGIAAETAPALQSIWTRWRFQASIAASLAVLVLIAFWAWNESIPAFATPADVVRHSKHWLAGVTDSRWHYDRFPNQEFPLPAALHGLRSIYRWQEVAGTSPALKVVCYNISPQPDTQLFVCLGAPSPTLPASPPATPYPLMPGWLVGGWQSESGVVYVLAVQGSDRHYQAILQRNQKVAFHAIQQPRA